LKGSSLINDLTPENRDDKVVCGQEWSSHYRYYCKCCKCTKTI